MKNFKEDLWLFDFVHSIEKPTCLTEEEVAIEKGAFREAFLTLPKKQDKRTANSEDLSSLVSEQLSLFDTTNNQRDGSFG
ncbi:hypothetical protein ACM26V_13815 [Salipaludibacillus sp. HK11]|uniref:hypothetical protein n=1 Tax=Salipaludibacillus sp. HK11 TaxID=3394320 RepID=UPI0039FD05F3